MTFNRRGFLAALAGAILGPKWIQRQQRGVSIRLLRRYDGDRNISRMDLLYGVTRGTGYLRIRDRYIIPALQAQERASIVRQLT